MKNLTRLLISTLLTFNISASDLFFQKPDSSYEAKEVYAESHHIEYFARQPNEFDSAFEAQGKKIALVDPKESYNYINMINPKSVQNYARRVPTEGKSNMQIAEAFFNFLKNCGIKCFLGPDYGKKDLLKDPSQTLADGGGDCADLSISLASFLELKGVTIALAAFYEETKKGYEEAHMIPLFKVEKEEAKNLRHKVIFPDSTFWIPIETNMISDWTFEQATAEAINHFEDFDLYIIFLFQDQN